jgi:folate-dependent phosphoribosylglycinamide formyltransferase PurN
MGNAFDTTPATPATTADGYYAKRAKVLLASGQDNFDAILQLDGSAVADEAVVQGVLDDTDAYVDGRAAVAGIAFARSRKEAKQERDELLGAYRQTQLPAAGADGMVAIGGECNCVPCDAVRTCR